MHDHVVAENSGGHISDRHLADRHIPDDYGHDESTLERYVAVVNDLTVISGIARLTERRSERGQSVDEEQLRHDMRSIQEAVERIRLRL
ncbi:MAG TPA: hypothetical protein VGT61_07370 [Thermomicrobiales bacterium]|jgi:hypothetical protein|nr:hypothetical protein [Thermomicrobiales bacterium]